MILEQRFLTSAFTVYDSQTLDILFQWTFCSSLKMGEKQFLTGVSQQLVSVVTIVFTTQYTTDNNICDHQHLTLVTSSQAQCLQIYPWINLLMVCSSSDTRRQIYFPAGGPNSQQVISSYIIYSYVHNLCRPWFFKGFLQSKFYLSDLFRDLNFTKGYCFPQILNI